MRTIRSGVPVAAECPRSLRGHEERSAGRATDDDAERADRNGRSSSSRLRRREGKARTIFGRTSWERAIALAASVRRLQRSEYRPNRRARALPARCRPAHQGRCNGEVHGGLRRTARARRTTALTSSYSRTSSTRSPLASGPNCSDVLRSAHETVGRYS